AVVFFFGGGFRAGTPAQFLRHCEYFSSRGMVAITADYRVRSRHKTTPADSVEDGKSAMRYVRANAGRLGIDPQRIVASGGSAGGMIAACVGTIRDAGKNDQEKSVSYTPNAMVLFNPAIMGKTGIKRADAAGRPSFTKDILPYYHVRKGLPPSIMFFGTEDRLLGGAEEFREAALEKGNRCELLTWKGVGHGFFNFGRNKNVEFVATVKAADKFLASLGYLEGEPTVDQFMKKLK
ncbi:MAG: alpha/beta hydrolase, partial [Planctomycetota bacterium]